MNPRQIDRKTRKTRSPNVLIKINNWLETHWVTPSYTGWVIFFIGLAFFGAATNTMAGWLYVLSGVIFAFLALNIIVARNTVKQLEIKRSLVEAVSAGDQLSLELIIKNPQKTAKTLLQIIDQLPSVLSSPVINNLEVIPPQKTIKWIYYAHTDRRGIYHWQDLDLKTAAPLGLTYCRRTRQIPIKAIVYPEVLPLKTCPIIDNIGAEQTKQRQSERLYRAASEGVTKTLRQYRYGDPMRLIHWRSSAKFGDFQVRELETITGGEEVIIALDNASNWEDEIFEQAVIAAASMYFYASRQQLEVKLWTAETGTIHGNRVVLETLAGVEFATQTSNYSLPSTPTIWLSSHTGFFSQLPEGSRYFLFDESLNPHSNNEKSLTGIVYRKKESLESQLQKSLTLHT